VQSCLLPEEVSNKTFIFSTFFMGKLLGDQLKDDLFPDREILNAVDKTKKKVLESYSSMKRWTKKIDLFSK
jgi:Ulp1 family protease